MSGSLDKAQKVFNNSIAYSIGSIGTKAFSFFLVPIYTYYMSSSDYGIATTVLLFTSTFGIFIMLSLESAIIRFYPEYEGEQLKVFMGSVFLFVCVSSLVVCILLSLFKGLYMPILFKDVNFYPIVFYGVVSLCTNGVYLVYQSYLRAKQDGKNYTINSFIYVGVHAIAVVILVAYLKMGAEGMILANCITNSSFAIYGFLSLHLHRYMRLIIDVGMLKQALKYSIPIIPHDIFNSLDSYIIKVIINNRISYSISGLYTLASQFSMVFSIVATSVNLAFRPWVFEQMRDPEGRQIIKHMSCMIMALYAFSAVIISAFSKEIVIIMSSNEFEKAWEWVPLFILAQLITFIYYSNIQSVFYNISSTKYVAICSLSSCMIDVAFTLCFINRINIYAVLIGQILSKIVLAFVAVRLNKKAENVDFGLKRMIIYIIIATILMVTGTVISYLNNIVLELGLKICLGIISYFAFMHEYRKDYLFLFRGLIGR